MPTGYTAGILDGTIKDFPQFAKLCMRAFGATIMMRDEPLYKDWKPRVPSDYHKKALVEAKKDLLEANRLTNEELILKTKESLLKDKLHYEKSIIETLESREKLNALMAEAERFSPPTEEHDGIKSFMIEQLKMTIDGDGNPEFAEKTLKNINESLLNLNAKNEREKLIESAEKNIAYHSKGYDEEIKRCEQSNKWVVDLLNSLQ